MGQYYKLCNIDKKEYLNPHTFGNGFKLMEFTSDGQGVLQGLSILLANGNGRGGGDFRHESHLIGSWAGDRITIEGDYADDSLWEVMHPTRHGDDGEEPNPKYQAGWSDISEDVFELLMKDEYLKSKEKEILDKWGMPTYNESRTKLLTKIFGNGNENN
tara:strand:- start:496 stop:972 length:477 start_codon:yes stop_codon:yes gene_type:complete